MSMASTAKRLTYLTHRWLGVAGCLLMLAWFVSGVVMLFVGYPKLTPWERLAPLPALDPAACCVSLQQAAGGRSQGAQTVLTSVRGSPVYVTRAPNTGFQVYPAAREGAPHGAASMAHGPRAAALLPDERHRFGFGAALGGTSGQSTGEPARGPGVTPARVTGGGPLPPVSVRQALQEAWEFSGRPGLYGGLVDEDRWTHSRGLDAHRPLHRVEIPGASPVTLYISSRTGQVVMDAPLSQQRWNYAGAWLHWLYMFRSASVDPVWDWIVIVLSAAGVVSALTGVVVGIWRWRFRGRYKSGSHSPYRGSWMKWHHIAGLLFSAIVCTWIFSGLMSMNPGGVFSAPPPGPDILAYSGAPAANNPVPGGVREDSVQLSGMEGGTAPRPESKTGEETLSQPRTPGTTATRDAASADTEALSRPAIVIQKLRDAGFLPVELQWHRIAGRPYVLAYDAAARTRIVARRGGALAGARAGGWAAAALGEGLAADLRDELTVLEHFTPADVLPAARSLFSAPLTAHSVLTDYDRYYYPRHPEAMNGAQQYGLPALRADYADPGRTSVYIDLRTGKVARSFSDAQRSGRWLFYFLHSWDTPPLLQAGPLRDAVLILLSLGGIVVSATGVVIGLRLLRRSASSRHPRIS